MKNKDFSRNIKKHIDNEIEIASNLLDSGNLESAFYHLERSHVLGQSITTEHTKVHWLMLKIGWQKRDYREVFGQFIRIIGAATKTPFGIYPSGNTGGSNVWFFKPIPISDDLQTILNEARN